MNKLKCNALLILALLISLSGIAKEEFKREINKEFNVNENTTFDISSKFGDISIENTDEAKMSIRVVITARASDEEDAKKIFDKIQIGIKEEGNKISAETVVHADKMKNIQIDYFIKMPSYIASTISNKFGSVLINSLTRASSITVAYGNLRAKKLLFDNKNEQGKVKLSYASGCVIDECNWLNVDVKYSDLEIGRGKALVFESKNSNIEIDDVMALIVKSKYDNYEVGSAQNAVINAKFGNYEIGNIVKKLDIELQYGNMVVGNVVEGFDLIKINNKYADVDVKIDEGQSYKLTALVEYADIDFPDGENINTHRDNSSLKVDGFVGDKTTDSEVIVVSKYGGVDLD
jgi:hypothetical protein